MTTSEAIVAFLVAQGLGIAGTTIFKGTAASIPNDDGPYLSVLEPAGGPPGATQSEPLALRYPRPQIVVRGADSDAARALAEQAFTACSGVTNQALGDVFFLSLSPRSDVFDLGLDAQQRARWAFNLTACRRG